MQKRTTANYRDRTEIVRQILDCVNNYERITKTKLMYKVFLSYSQLKEYLLLLTEKDLLSYDPLDQTYKITEKGTRLLQLCNQLDEMMIKKVSQPQQRKRRREQANIPLHAGSE